MDKILILLMVLFASGSGSEAFATGSITHILWMLLVIGAMVGVVHLLSGQSRSEPAPRREPSAVPTR